MFFTKTQIIFLRYQFDSSAIGFDLVQTHRILGVTLDAELAFIPHAKATLAMGRSLFDELYQAAEAGGFPVCVLAPQVLIRIAPAVLADAAALAAVPILSAISIACKRTRPPWDTDVALG